MPSFRLVIPMKFALFPVIIAIPFPFLLKVPIPERSCILSSCVFVKFRVAPASIEVFPPK